jgi:flagellar protein FliS
MNPANPNAALNAYRKVGVESGAISSNPHQLVLMLFNGARAVLAEAKGHLERREIAARGMAISKAITIIDGGLKASLDLKVGGDLAQSLSDLYVYMGQRLLYANLKEDGKALDEVAGLLAQLGEAWETMAVKPAAATRVSPMPPSHAPSASQTPANRVAAAYGIL